MCVRKRVCVRERQTEYTSYIRPASRGGGVQEAGRKVEAMNGISLGVLATSWAWPWSAFSLSKSPVPNPQHERNPVVPEGPLGKAHLEASLAGTLGPKASTTGPGGQQRARLPS